MIHFVLLAGCAALIYIACEWFINAVEWLGVRLRLGPLAVGTILAAFGTALPESAVTFVAVVFGTGSAQKDIGVGAAMGGPLVLSTVAYGITGAMILLTRGRRRTRVPSGGPPAGAVPDPAPSDPASPSDRASSPPDRASSPPDRASSGPASRGAGTAATTTAASAEAGVGNVGSLARDQRWFLAIFVVKVALGLVAFRIKPWLGLLFFAAYGVYFWREIRTTGGTGEGAELEPLRFQPGRSKPNTTAIAAQSLVTLTVIFLASQLFVRQLNAVGPILGLPPAVTALLLSPIATELPEIMNAIIWVRQGKNALALANISGAMMIQATVPSGLGILFTPWRFGGALILSGAITIAAIGYLLLLLRTKRFRPRTLAVAAAFYLLFAVCLVPLIR